MYNLHQSKKIQTIAHILPFLGTDNFFFREFITLCENVIKRSSITADADRISVICSRLLPVLRGFNLMQNSDFSLTDMGSDCEHFMRNFLKQVSHTIVSLQSNAALCPIVDSLIVTNQLAITV